MYDQQENRLGTLIKSRAREKGWSMRKLSQYVQMDQATLSRIVNGKQKANLNHMRKLAQVLEVSMHELIEATGFSVELEEQHENKVPKPDEKVKVMEDIFRFYQMPNDPLLVDKIKVELEKYEAYALTHEGEELIHTRLEDKVKALSAEGPFIERMKKLHQRFKKEGLSKEEKQIIGSGLLYFIISTDIIPDYIFPIGYLDDVLAIQLVEEKIRALNI